MKNDELMIFALTEGQKARACGYWYTVTRQGMPHTAFRTREAVESWLVALGLRLESPLPATKGEHACIKILGSYRRELCMCSKEAFLDLAGIPATVLENGSYTTGKLHTDGNGLRVLYVPNPNCDWQDKHNFRECEAMKDAGVTII